MMTSVPFDWSFMIQLGNNKELMLDHFKNVKVFYNLMPFIEWLLYYKDCWQVCCL